MQSIRSIQGNPVNKRHIRGVRVKMNKAAMRQRTRRQVMSGDIMSITAVHEHSVRYTNEVVEQLRGYAMK